MKERIDTLHETLSLKMDDVLEKLSKQSSGEEISKSVQFLAKRAQFQKGYTQDPKE